MFIFHIGSSVSKMVYSESKLRLLFFVYLEEASTRYLHAALSKIPLFPWTSSRRILSTRLAEPDLLHLAGLGPTYLKIITGSTVAVLASFQYIVYTTHSTCFFQISLVFQGIDILFFMQK